MNDYQQKLSEKHLLPNKARVGNVEFNCIPSLPENFEGDLSKLDPSLIQALELTYDVYIKEKKYIPKEDISDEQNDLGMLWNKYDSDVNTTQIVGVRDNEVICRFRLSDNFFPLSETFNLQKYYNGLPLRESSRFIIREDNRGMRTFKYLSAYEYHVSKPLGQIFWTGLHDSTPIYEKAGAQTLAYYNYTEFPNHPGMATLQRWDLDNLLTISKTQEKASQRFIESIISTPIEYENE